MSLSTQDRSQIIESHRTSAQDVGSTQVQIALLTARIKGLTEHFKEHKHDHHSRRGLLRMVSSRRKLLAYMKRCDATGYRDLVKQLGLRS